MHIARMLWLLLGFSLLTSLAATAAAPLRIVCLGDSLTAGYGLDPAQAWPALVEQALRAEPERGELVVVNAGLSGDTSAGGLRRVAWVLRQPTAVLVLALGANDALRSLSPQACEENLRATLRLAREKQPGVRLVVAGMLAPPNLGPEYAEAFNPIFARVAREAEAEFVPFLLEGVAGVPELNQADGLHPTAEGQQRLAALMGPAIRRALEAAK